MMGKRRVERALLFCEFSLDRHVIRMLLVGDRLATARSGDCARNVRLNLHASSRADFAYDRAADACTCPGGKLLKFGWRAFKVPPDGRAGGRTIRYIASKHDCEPCALKPI